MLSFKAVAPLVVCLYVSFGFAPCVAQTSVPAEKRDLPDAPSMSREREQTEPVLPAQSSQPSLQILYRRSHLFPDLATTKEPLTATEKFELFVANSLSPLSVGGASLSAGISQARDSHEAYGQEVGGYGKRLGASMARSASSQFFGTFVFATMFGQDPRYFPLKDPSFKQAVKHALLRVVITQSDSGVEAPNMSRLLGFLAAEGLANAYLPDDERTVGSTFKRTGKDIGIRAGTNVLREYWPTIFKRLRKPPSNSPVSRPSGAAPDPSST